MATTFEAETYHDVTPHGTPLDDPHTERCGHAHRKYQTAFKCAAESYPWISVAKVKIVDVSTDLWQFASVTLDRACGHEDTVEVKLDDALLPPAPAIHRAERALCEPCYKEWDSDPRIVFAVGWAYCRPCRVHASVGADRMPVCAVCGMVMELNRRKENDADRRRKAAAEDARSASVAGLVAERAGGGS